MVLGLMAVSPLTKMTKNAEVSLRRLGGRPRYGWKYGVKTALNGINVVEGASERARGSEQMSLVRPERAYGKPAAPVAEICFIVFYMIRNECWIRYQNLGTGRSRYVGQACPTTRAVFVMSEYVVCPGCTIFHHVSNRLGNSLVAIALVFVSSNMAEQSLEPNRALCFFFYVYFLHDSSPLSDLAVPMRAVSSVCAHHMRWIVVLEISNIFNAERFRLCCAVFQS